jgi:hypothetical protein
MHGWATGAGTTARLKQAGMEFAVWIFKHASDEQLKPMAPIILASLIKLLDGSDVNDPGDFLKLTTMCIFAARCVICQSLIPLTCRTSPQFLQNWNTKIGRVQDAEMMLYLFLAGSAFTLRALMWGRWSVVIITADNADGQIDTCCFSKEHYDVLYWRKEGLFCGLPLLLFRLL